MYIHLSLYINTRSCTYSFPYTQFKLVNNQVTLVLNVRFTDTCLYFINSCKETSCIVYISFINSCEYISHPHLFIQLSNYNITISLTNRFPTVVASAWALYKIIHPQHEFSLLSGFMQDNSPHRVSLLLGFVQRNSFI